MIIDKKKWGQTWARLIVIGVIVCACKSDLSDDPIPPATFADYNVNLAFPEYTKLRLDGGYVVIGSIGVRGVILYHKTGTTYYAYEINCSYHPNEVTANVSVDASNLFLRCSGCGSSFNFSDGSPSGGIAWRALRKYQTVFDAGTVTISNNIIN